MRRTTCLLIAIILGFSANVTAFAKEEKTPKGGFESAAPYAILIEQSTGEVLYEKNADEQLPPASITKIMTLLLTMEAIERGDISLEDKVTTSTEASKMGGSQIWLKEGEVMTVNELLKAAAISSANDASYALAELIGSSHDGFVGMMNDRAKELKMNNTHFVNCTGLDADGHLTTARDIAIMSNELIKHDKIREYSTVWMDSLRDGATQLVNTNRLIKTYKGTTGLKTGTTDLAGKCLSATAQRDDFALTAVVLGLKTSEERFQTAR
ncbi:MAG: D-alanyl-D-alanine carboxypeptidase family protein, partial [Oscillospiraceae bacterium]